MKFLPADRFQRTLFGAFLLFFAVSCLNPPYLQFMLMQHVPTVLVLFALVWFCNHYAISRTSFVLVLAFLSLHTLGARYLYSYVPYDQWSERLTGTSISELFGFERNHYDRVVHFSYGLLLAVPIQEFERRHLGLTVSVSSVLAIECILATSAIYELLEWLIAITFAPDWAESFLGQQGDIFDAQKDMALAALGSVISIGAVTLLSCNRNR